MKLYVLPVETICNASCSFCITDFRETSKREFLDIGDLEKVLGRNDWEAIEITGGGEPILHKQIKDIANSCIEKARTQIYTNGALFERIADVKKLEFLSVSRAHYLDCENERIMGINYNINQIFRSNIPIKLSLLLHNSGIHKEEEIVKYLDWAEQNGVRKVVVRQLFDHDYGSALKEEFVSTREMARSFVSQVGENNVLFKWKEMPVEFETRSCACEFHNPVLHADGILYRGWSREVLDDTYRA